jgi:hypothetical protein
MTTLVKNTRDTTVATLQDMQVDTSTPLTFIGRGYAGFGSYIQSDLYKLMENFASDTPPSAPAEGQLWYAVTAQSLSFYNNSRWVELSTGNNIMGAMLSRLSGADSINFKNAGSATVHTAATGTSSLVSGVLIIPQAGASVTGNSIPSFSLEVTAASGDICDKVAMLGLTAATKFYYHSISGTNRIIAAGETVSLVKDTLIDVADTLIGDAYLFGHILNT